MKRGVPSTIKFENLCRMLSIRKYEGVGLLEGIWHLTATQAKRGDIGKFSNVEIALWLGWSGDPDILISTLVQTGWLDECSVHRLIVPHWAEHCDQTVRRSE